MEMLNLGFIGGGINSAVGNTHRIASQMDNRWLLKAGCFSRAKEINQETALNYLIEPNRLYDEWHDLLAKEKGKLDAICILTPTIVHAEMVLEALKSGYAVICEKALATTLKEATDICNVVEETSGFLAVTYNYTGYPMLRELRKMILDGKLGNLNQVLIEMPQEGFARFGNLGQKPKPQYWRLKDGIVPTISLDLGVHLHHIIYFLSGEKPLEVVADYSTHGFFKNIVDNIMCLARYTGNLKAQVWYSKSALGHRNGLRVRIYGDQGSAEWLQLYPEEIKFNDINGNHQILDRTTTNSMANELRYNRFKPGHPAGFIEAFANHYCDIADSLLEYKKKQTFSSPYVFDGNQARDGLEMLEAISASVKTGTWQLIKSNII